MEKKSTHRTFVKGIAHSFVLATALVGALLIGASSAYAATLDFSPANGTYETGSTVAVRVLVSSTDQAINAIAGTLVFPADKLSVSSVAEAGSVVSYWVKTPTYDNTAGTVSFEGIIPNPGFTGGNGNVVTVYFTVKAAGVASVYFSSGSVLANDGKGTNVLTTMASAQFLLGGAVPSVPRSTTSVSASTTPAAPVITSSTHPDPNRWYARPDAQFSWSNPSDVTAVRVLVSQSPRATPSATYAPPIHQKDAQGLSDGVWYLHVQQKNANGWGDISHFRVQIDTTPPDRFSISEVPRPDTTDPVAVLSFAAHDALSGINHYDIQIDGKKAQTWVDDGSHRYDTPTLSSGVLTINVKAVDAAGNALHRSLSVKVAAIESPTITSYTKKINSNESLVVRGATYPASHVTIWLRKDHELASRFAVGSDEAGKFTFVSDESPSEGTYQLWAVVEDGRGATSDPSKKVSLVVTRPPLIQFGEWTLGLLAIVVPLIIAVFILLAVLWYGLERFKKFRRRVRKEADEAEKELHRSITSLRRGFLRRAGKKLKKIETSIEKEIKDIKRVK